MNIEEMNKNWTSLGKQDPLWAILSDPQKKGNRWQKDEFFEAGRQDIERLLKKLESSGFSISFGKALDFGCGVGRLTQALAEKFESVDGVDIASSMINSAGQFNRFPGRVAYHLNTRGDLSIFPSNQYDFICSMVVLIHIPHKLQQSYLNDFLRMLKPGGIAYFESCNTQGWRNVVPDWAADFYRKFKHKGKPFIPMYGIPIEEVHKIVRDAGGTVVKYESYPFTDHPSRFEGNNYYVKKQT
jgi:2-polyprenyl-3-methyl-5-hydroxy-6-metoxy-1,4-benzoquinol methylase